MRNAPLNAVTFVSRRGRLPRRPVRGHEFFMPACSKALYHCICINLHTRIGLRNVQKVCHQWNGSAGMLFGGAVLVRWCCGIYERAAAALRHARRPLRYV